MIHARETAGAIFKVDVFRQGTHQQVEQVFFLLQRRFHARLAGDIAKCSNAAANRAGLDTRLRMALHRPAVFQVKDGIAGGV
jgi:hypothetical protein